MAPPLHADLGYLGPKIGGKLEKVTKKKRSSTFCGRENKFLNTPLYVRI
jgi:hypothetical protein